MGEYKSCRYCGTFFDSDENEPTSCSYHPKLPVLIGNTGPRGDYAELWNFPCCGKTVPTDTVEDRDVKPEQTPGCVVSRHVRETGWSVFISYAREDETWARNVENELRRRGHRAWRDRSELVGGTHWTEAIDEAIARADHFIVLLTPRSVASTEVARELSLALHGGKNVVPVLAEECKIPTQIRHINCVDWRRLEPTSSYQDWFDGLREALIFGGAGGAWVEPPPEDPPTAGRHGKRRARPSSAKSPQQLVVLRDQDGESIGAIRPLKRYAWRVGHVVTLEGVVYVVKEVLQDTRSAAVVRVERAELGEHHNPS